MNQGRRGYKPSGDVPVGENAGFVPMDEDELAVSFSLAARTQ